MALNNTSGDAGQKSKSVVGASINLYDIEKNKNDVASLNSDLQLLSTLLGRPVSQKELSKITNSNAIGSTSPSFNSFQNLATATIATTKNTPAAQFAQEVIKQIGDDAQPNESDGDNDLTSTDDELASIDPSDAYGKTNDALLATLLKQRGIGPAHNNLPLDIYSTTTTERPRLQPPSRSSRPLLDGLTWLWKTWQDTAPGNLNQPQSSRTRTRDANGNANNPDTTLTMIDTVDEPSDSFDDGLDADISSVCKDNYLFFFFKKILLIIEPIYRFLHSNSSR